MLKIYHNPHGEIFIKELVLARTLFHNLYIFLKNTLQYIEAIFTCSFALHKLMLIASLMEAVTQEELRSPPAGIHVVHYLLAAAFLRPPSSLRPGRWLPGLPVPLKL